MPRRANSRQGVPVFNATSPDNNDGLSGEGENLTTQGSEVNILLVDDRAENLLALEAILDEPDYRLFRATSGKEALEYAAQSDFAVILLDVAMPEMTGFDVAYRLKKSAHTKYIPILFVTAVACGMEDIYRAYAVGAVDYLMKPLDTRTVQSKVRVFADLYRQRKQLEEQARLLYENERREHALKIAEFRVASDERYSKLIDGIDSAFGWTSDAGGERLYFVSRRATELLGYSFTQLAEPGFLFRAVPADERETVKRTFADAAEQMRDGDVVHRLRAADGSERWFHTGLSPALDPAAGSVVLHGFSVDVTALKSAEETAAKATRVRDQVLQIVSHDLRNLLACVRLHSQRAHNALVAGEATTLGAVPENSWIISISSRCGAKKILQQARAA